jgi:hypothetical protein
MGYFNTNHNTMKNTGIWIDSREAKIVFLEGSKIDVNTIFSGAERKPKIMGEKSKGTVRGFTGFDFKSSQESHYREELKRYYKSVINAISGSDNLYIFGPAEAKINLEKEIRNDQRLSDTVLRVESCDVLTQNQLIEKVSQFYRTFKLPVRKKTKVRLAS